MGIHKQKQAQTRSKRAQAQYTVVLQMFLEEISFNLQHLRAEQMSLVCKFEGTLYFMVKKLPLPMPSRANA